MSGINAALNDAANNLGALERSLLVIQQNVGNASTPGYARQDLGGAIDSFSDSNLTQTINSRDEFAETAVRQQNTLFGYSDQLNSILQTAQSNFPASGDTGLPAAINNLFSSFSALTTSPNDPTARQQVIAQAGQVALAFNSTAANLANTAGDTRQQISSEVDTINHLAGLVQRYNTTRQANAGGAPDPIADAKLHDTLEQLSEYGNIQSLTQSDGSVTLLLGQTALVVGQTQFPIASQAAPGGTAKIVDSHGVDITSQISGGRLGGSLEALNQSLPAYVSGLNQLAQGVADSVNGTLAGGVDSNGAAGAPLFTYDSSTGAAATLAVTNITPDQLAAASPSAPGGNGNALALSALGTTQNLNGFTFAGFYGNLAATVGQDVSNASSAQSVETQLLSQARAQRTAASGVSLDEAAVQLVEFQKAYEATAKVVTILDQLSADTINMITGT
jgi:flagellar hook-associated protein 1 FlgK